MSNSDLKLVLENVFDSDIWITESLNLMNFTLEVIQNSITPYGYDFQRVITSTIKCNDCYWQGREEDLVRGEDKESFFDGCPICNTDEYLMNISPKIQFTPVDSNGEPLSEELILECIFEYNFL